MYLIKKLICFILIILQINLFSETKILKSKDIHPIVEQMMIYHVENQQMTPAIIRRSFKVLFEQFDVEKTYFLQSEVENYLELTDSAAEKVLIKLQKEDYKDYQLALKQIQSSIYRARNIRAKKLDELKKKQFVVVAPPLLVDNTGFCQNKAHLTSRIEAQVYSWLEAEKRDSNFMNFTVEEKDRSLRIWEKRLQKYENTYLGLDMKGSDLPKAQQEHAFATLIIKTFAKSLDAHTAFFSPEEAMSMRTSLQKQFKGIGVVLKENGQGVMIADLIKGGPAFSSKVIEKGDLLIAINGVKIQDKSFEDILEMMQGMEGSAIKLTLKKKLDDASRPFDVVLIRQKIIMDDERLSYSYEPFADGIIGKIQFNAFYDNGEGVTTEKDFKEALKNLREKGNILGLVIDLRQNPGGFLSQAVKVAGLFIPKGIVAIAKYSTGEIQYSRDLDGRLCFGGPVVLMTSKASASAAEVVAQALQDYGVAIVVGDERTYGKGSMQFQNITDENAAAFFKVTVGRYYTVSGRSTQIDGVLADIVVPSYYAPYPIGERFLQFPITRDDLGFSFIDPNNPVRKLAGVDSQHLFSSYFPKQQLKWKTLLPKLAANSKQRMEHNLRYVEYLNKVTAYQEGKKVVIDPWKEDLQLQESMEIMRDMIILDRIRE